jgi:hypothetical protein
LPGEAAERRCDAACVAERPWCAQHWLRHRQGQSLRGRSALRASP